MSPNQQQHDAWNGPESTHYVDHADRYDRQLEPITGALLQRAAIEAHQAVLDIGCGCGAATLAAAASCRRALGVDISEPLVSVAVSRAQLASLDRAEFLVADAQTHAFEEGAFDILISQFGLMFFEDPVGAFSNLWRALAPNGRIVFASWRGIADNEWLAPVRSAVQRYTTVPDLGGLANGGGMFQLRDRSETVGLMEAAGFEGIVVDQIDSPLLIGGGGSLDETADFLFGMGIVRGLLGPLDDGQRGSAIAEVRAELEHLHEEGVGVRLGSGVWLVSAQVGTGARSARRR